MTPVQKLPPRRIGTFESVFPGGSGSKEYAAYRAAAREKLVA